MIIMGSMSAPSPNEDDDGDDDNAGQAVSSCRGPVPCPETLTLISPAEKQHRLSATNSCSRLCIAAIGGLRDPAWARQCETVVSMAKSPLCEVAMVLQRRAMQAVIG
jgi:hypothetical protein